MTEEERFPEFKELWNTLFKGVWPMWVAGLLLGFLNVCLFLVKSPWGGTGSYVSWGQNIYQTLGLLETPGLKSVLENRYGLLGLMTVLGATCAALMGRQFCLRIATIGELFKGLLGGILMGIGATIGLGCTIGGFLTGWSALSSGAIFLTVGLMIGTIIGFRYLLWEMDHLPFMRKGKRFEFLKVRNRKSPLQPILGMILFIGLLVAALVYYASLPILTWFAICGLLIGVICQRSKFCVVRAFREPFLTGISEAPIGIFVALMVGIFGFTLIKYMGIGTNSPEEARALALTGVHANFWLRGLIGGLIFGLGMVTAGGCAVGAMWRAGEGHIQLWFAMLGLMLAAPLSKKFLVPKVTAVIPEWGRLKIFMPDWVGYGGAVLIFLLIILAWYLFVTWNERTDKFTCM